MMMALWCRFSLQSIVCGGQVMPVGLVLRLVMPIWQVLRTTDLPWWH
jgi:hypothetical protein